MAQSVPIAIAPSSLASSSVDSSPAEEKLKEQVAVSVTEYWPSDAALELPPNAGGEGDDAIANEPSPFDDLEMRKFYWPRKDYEGIHRFFPDFKWTVGEEKK
jgi:hypothetical protein